MTGRRVRSAAAPGRGKLLVGKLLLGTLCSAACFSVAALPIR